MSGESWPHEKPPWHPGAQAITAALSQPQPDTTVCTVTGKISGDTSPVLRDALTQGRRDDNAHLVIDLSAVTSMDATGLYVLFEALSKHNVGGGHLAVVADSHSESIPELHIVALEAAFDLHPSLAGALQACANARPGT